MLDEVHTVKTWGEDFRKVFLDLKQLKTSYPDVPLLGLTATVNQNYMKDIFRHLSLNESCILVFRSSFNRHNLFFKLVNKQTLANTSLAAYITTIINTKYKNKSGIIYCMTIKQVVSLQTELVSKGLSCGIYHG